MLRLYLLKEIHIYENINTLKVTNSGYTGYFWAPNGELGQKENPQSIKDALREFDEKYKGETLPRIEQIPIPRKKSPPTYF